MDGTVELSGCLSGVERPGWRTAVLSHAVRAAGLAAWLGLIVCCGAGCRMRQSAEAARFEAARELVVRGQYAASIPELEGFLRDHPRHVDASRACLFLGKAHLALDDHALARDAFRRGAEQYANTLEGHKCRYKLALLEMLDGREAEALEAFRKLADQPDGPLAAEATAMVRFLQDRSEAARPAPP